MTGACAVETDGAGGRRIEAAAPDGAWRAGADGKPADDPGGYEAARRYAALVFGDALTGRDGAEVALAGSAEAEDHTWTVVRVTFGDADTYDVLLEPVVGALCCYRITEKGVTREVLFTDWRLVDGVRVPVRPADPARRRRVRRPPGRCGGQPAARPVAVRQTGRSRYRAASAGCRGANASGSSSSRSISQATPAPSS